MRYLSVCAGIEAATVAWHPLGWQPVAFSEIDAFPRAVLAHHYPTVPLAGDFTKLRGDEYGAIDLLVGGTPCQDFSVAGKRAGVDGGRGNLTLEFSELARRARSRWLVWENVPGVFSLNGGRDFGAVIACFAGYPEGSVFDPPVDGWQSFGIVPAADPDSYGLAWRVLDAQYFGVAQRRARVFVVGYLGDWRRAAAVLLELESLRGNPPPSREAGQDVAGAIAARSFDGGAGGRPEGAAAGHFVADVAPTLSAGGNNTGGDRPPGTQVDTAESLIVMASGQANAEIVRDGSPSLTRLHEAPIVAGFAEVADPIAANQDRTYTREGSGNFRMSNVAIAFTAKDHGQDAGELSPTLRGGSAVNGNANGGVMPAVAFNITPSNSNKDYNARPSDRSQAIATTGNRPSARGGDLITNTTMVRRLTPRECERLQGFPEIHREVTIRVCASEEERLAIASCAAQSSAAQRHAQNEPVDVRVLIDLERSQVQILKAEKLIWSASDAARPSESPLSMPLAAFVRLAADMTTIAVPQIHDGAGASPPSIRGSLPRRSGSVLVPVSGLATEGLASDADRLAAEATTCTTSQPGQHSPTNASTLETLSCCVVAAIASCIRDLTQAGNSFSVSVETHAGYTFITYRGKPAADGPRYKALGNSMAVPVMRFIGERIAMVEALGAEAVAA